MDEALNADMPQAREALFEIVNMRISLRDYHRLRRLRIM